jgi:hypothetical protein
LEAVASEASKVHARASAQIGYSYSMAPVNRINTADRCAPADFFVQRQNSGESMMSKDIKTIVICASIFLLIAGTIFVLAKTNAYAAEASKAECDALHNEIETDFKKANFCKTDNDCKFMRLGGWYIDFGCYKYVNSATKEDELFAKIEKYKDVMGCSRKINDCMSPGTPVCVDKKCKGKPE